MSRQFYRFIQSVSTTITPLFGAKLTVGDTFSTILRRLQGLLAARETRVVLIAPVTGGTSTTNDIAVNSLAIPAGYLFAGSVLKIRMNGIFSKRRAIAKPMNIWVKVNGVKLATLSYAPNRTTTDQPFAADFNLVVQSVGASGVFYGSGKGFFIVGNGTVEVGADAGNTTTANTGGIVTITAGFDFTESNANNYLTCGVSIVDLE